MFSMIFMIVVKYDHAFFMNLLYMIYQSNISAMQMKILVILRNYFQTKKKSNSVSVILDKEIQLFVHKSSNF